MHRSIQPDQWIWVIIQDPDGNEQFLGQYDEENDVSFIPIFLEKEAALRCINLLAREKGRKYEVQAIIYEDLASRASKEGFKLFLLNAEGEVVEKMDPF